MRCQHCQHLEHVSSLKFESGTCDVAREAITSPGHDVAAARASTAFLRSRTNTSACRSIQSTLSFYATQPRHLCKPTDRLREANCAAALCHVPQLCHLRLAATRRYRRIASYISDISTVDSQGCHHWPPWPAVMRPSGTVACSHCSASLPRYPSSRDAAVTAASREPALSIRKQAVVSGLGQHGHRAADLVASSTSNRAATTAAHPVGGATSRVTDASTTAGACSNCDGASQGPSWQSFGPASPALDTRRPHSNILEADTTVQDRNTLHAAAASALAVALIYAGRLTLSQITVTHSRSRHSQSYIPSGRQICERLDSGLATYTRLVP